MGTYQQRIAYSVLAIDSIGSRLPGGVERDFAAIMRWWRANQLRCPIAARISDGRSEIASDTRIQSRLRPRARADRYGAREAFRVVVWPAVTVMVLSPLVVEGGVDPTHAWLL